MQKTGISGIILAGGKNARMGAEKALLRVGPNFIIEHISAALRIVAEEIIVVTSEPDKYARFGDRTVKDIMAGHGPLGGIHAGLACAGQPLALVTACDIPFVSAGLAALLINNAAGYDAVVPFYHGYAEPLFALYRKSCLGVIEELLNNNRNKITGFYQQVKVNFLNEQKLLEAETDLDRIFFNVNTPEDLKKAQKMV